jgi:hypothetical protein
MAEYYLIDLERTIGYNKPYYWKGNRHGYTSHIEQAGIFPEHMANEILKNDQDENTVKQHEGTTYY